MKNNTGSRWHLAWLLLAICSAGVAGEPGSATETENAAETLPEADAGIRAQLERLEIHHEVDEDNDFRIEILFDDDRSQFVWIRSRDYSSRDVAMRDVWSYGYRHRTKILPSRLERRLLTDSYKSVMGGWALDGNDVVYVVKLPIDASDELLQAALLEAAEWADELEKELVGTDEL